MTFDDIIKAIPYEPYFRDPTADIVIYCQDCRAVLPHIPDKSIDLVLTDPPYGVGKKYGDNYDDNSQGYWEWFLPVLIEIKQKALVVALHHRPQILKHITDWDWIAIWHKPISMGSRIGNSPVLPHWEPIILWGIHSLGTKRVSMPDVIRALPIPGGAAGLRNKGNGRKVMGREAHNLIDGSPHPFPKPTILTESLIYGLSSTDDIILDPFLGSGTTLVCAKKLGRRAIGIEIEERYCEIAKKRLAQSVMALETE